MEMYDSSDHGNVETYLIQGSQSAPLSTTSLIRNIETMYNEGAPEIVAEHGNYYPATAGYGYYYTGFESPGDWDQHGVFTVDGSEEYQGGEMENLPYLYYTPSYGYAQSPYNPYNPYIPGAVVGPDGSFMGPQQFLINSPYQDCVPSSNYPLTDGNGMRRPEVLLNNQSEPVADNKSAFVSKANSHFPKHNLSSSSAPYTTVASESPLNHPVNFKKAMDGARENGRPLQPSAYGRNNPTSCPRDDNVLNRSHVNNNQPEGDVPVGSDPAQPGSVADEQSSASIIIPDSNQRKGYSVKAKSEPPNDHTAKDINIRNKIIVKAYTSRIGKADAEGNIIIRTDQYNKEDMPIDYANAKFFVIKSYSEDDVHKSIKYNVWSSTPNGNRKLSNAYEDAESSSGGVPGGCPIFLYFSVNASGQFCGVAEMVGRVDFKRDMDFWQQDKWSGSFPVKWLVIKDVPNSNFRHIVLANNENKPVTNSRDTQEISLMQGREMLKIFKNHKLKTSIFDDFMYYENRQKVIHEGRIRLLTKTYCTSLCVPALDPRKLNGAIEYAPTGNEMPASVSVNNASTTATQKDILTSPSSPTEDENIAGPIGPKDQSETDVNCGILSTLMIGSLTIDSKGAELELLKPSRGPPAIVHPKPVETVTIGSMPVKVNGLSGSPGPLTFGSFPPDIKGFKRKNKH